MFLLFVAIILSSVNGCMRTIVTETTLPPFVTTTVPSEVTTVATTVTVTTTEAPTTTTEEPTTTTIAATACSACPTTIAPIITPWPSECPKQTVLPNPPVFNKVEMSGSCTAKISGCEAVILITNGWGCFSATTSSAEFTCRNGAWWFWDDMEVYSAVCSMI